MFDSRITTKTVPHICLNTGEAMPMLGLGVALSDEGTASSVIAAIENGYRMIDTAQAYGNEKEVGEGFRQTGIGRKDIFITTKLSVPDMAAGKVKQAFEASLERLGIEYVDLYLLHWPVVAQIEFSWHVLEDFYRQGLIKSIGVSNFQIHHLKSMQSYASVTPAVNQIECHPLLVQTELRNYCKQHDIAIEAWSPLGRARIFEEPILVEAARRYRKTVAQVVLRWHIQNGTIIVPKSTKVNRIIENSQIFDFELSDKDMNLVASLNRNHRFGSDPDNFHFDV